MASILMSSGRTLQCSQYNHYSLPQSAPKVCGPWVANNGQLSTHTDAEVGFIDTVFFGSDVKVDFVGLNFIIAHLRVGNIQIALGKPINVVPQRGR